MNRNDGIKKVAEIMKSAKLGNFATYDGTKIVSRPMGLQQVEFDGDAWFFTYKDSNKVGEILDNPNVNLSFDDGNSWVSLSGTAVIVDDKQKAEDLWNTFLKAWFPDGLKTDGLTLLKVHADTAEYWSSTDPKVVQLFGFIKAAVTGEQAKGGENETVQL